MAVFILPLRHNLCNVVCVMDYDGLSEKEIHYIDEARIIGRTEEIVLHELVYELEERIQTINPILHIHDIILISDLMVKRYSLQLKRYYDHQI